MSRLEFVVFTCMLKTMKKFKNISAIWLKFNLSQKISLYKNGGY